MTAAAPRLVDASGNAEAIRAFLEAHLETSMFLLSNLRAFGPRAGESPYSGDFRALVRGDEVLAVWCLTRGGNLVVQAGGDVTRAGAIVGDAVAREEPVRGVLGEWVVAAEVWRLLCQRRAVVPTHVSREVLYRMSLGSGLLDACTSTRTVRTLVASDFAAWEPLLLAFLREQRLPASTPVDRHGAFDRSTAQRHWWGAFEDGRLVSIASYNAWYRSTAQVGGVFTLPDRRGLGFARAVMQALIRDGVTTHGLDRLILFTGEDARPARALYESLGFQAIGLFGLFFGEPAAGRG